MSSGTKVALVALMVLMMVVIARLVNDDSRADGLDEPDAGAGGANAGATVGNAKGTREASDASGKSGLAAQKPEARSPAQQKAPKDDPRISANPSRRVSPAAPSGDPDRFGGASRERLSTRSSRSSPGASGRSAMSAPGDSRSSIPRLPEADPISGAPDGDDLGSRARGDATAGAPPVSIEGARTLSPSGESPAELVRRPQTPVVNTQLKVDGTGADPASNATSSTSSEVSGAPGEKRPSLAQGTSRRSTAGDVPVRSYNAGKTSEPPPSGTGSPSTQFPVSYTIEPNDSLWKIAAKYYGRGHLYKEIEAKNPGVKIQPGKTLIIPAPPSESSTSSAESGRGSATSSRASSTANVRRFGNAPPTTATTATRAPQARMHTVEKGETLWEIAGQVYGDPTLWVRIKNANPELKNGDDIKAGMKIVIP